jgi:thiol-disulfide isomerase/thioredoxin
MRKSYLSIMFIVLLALVMGPVTVAQAATYGKGSMVAAEDLMLKPLDGGDKVNIVNGKPTIVAIMQSACGVCLQELQTIQKWQNANSGKAQLSIVNVDMMPSKERLEAYAKKLELKGAWYLDPEFAFGTKFGLTFTPVTILLDGDAKVLFLVRGFNPGNPGEFTDLLDQLY